ncbi:BAH_G0003930.mRNA.1.CDS.1 [Saccharomyces cerevisiae]|nr:SX2_G0016090.mRNA.1.CDS.1 [Saccharomyces cerevisiae]CAI4272894.1 BAG_1a_G0003930.mRNA.1.CDS.1 [Saccharomyces cerevisiae]CAI4274399.1 BAH_G0003930.mRNA.1.CDS.1 [Saccharomyces cerevisiae]CAI7048423.1 BAG_1a_G0003930.mRNA.1.CDS.1 [Saccharomyces cerevisiae]CAI7048552.1 BAH_G0003930.mRNA.1.CDS.1 [Saccharomyces cerevisiae]
MDAVILNLLGDIPLVTRLWTIGCLVLSGLTSLRIVDPGKVVYSYDLVFKKGQYGRLLYSIFDYGAFNWISMINIFVSANHLSTLENSFNLRRKFCWIIFLLLVILVKMTSIEQPAASLGVLLHENLVYYELKKNGNQMNVRFFGVIDVSPSIFPIYMNAVMYFVYKRSWLEIAMNFMPGHVIYYMDDIIGKIYGIDLCKSPYDWFRNPETP